MYLLLLAFAHFCLLQLRHRADHWQSTILSTFISRCQFRKKIKNILTEIEIFKLHLKWFVRFNRWRMNSLPPHLRSLRRRATQISLRIQCLCCKSFVGLQLSIQLNFVCYFFFLGHCKKCTEEKKKRLHITDNLISDKKK